MSESLTEQCWELMYRYEGFRERPIENWEYVLLFSRLIRTGHAWRLQGAFYGAPAMQLREAGLLTAHGDITEIAVKLFPELGPCPLCGAAPTIEKPIIDGEGQDSKCACGTDLHYPFKGCRDCHDART